VVAGLAVAAWVERPGAILEVALIAVAGAALWIAAAARPRTPSTLALVLLAFVVPLTNTWPGRGWTLAIGHLPMGVDALFTASSLLLALVALVTLRSPRRGRAPRLLLVAAGLLAAGAVVSTVAAASAASAASTLLEFLVPIAIGALVIRVRPAVEDAWLIVTALLAAVTVPAVVGIASYVLQLGFPTSPLDLARGKSELTNPLMFQALTYGNVDHFTTLAVLLLPVAVVGATRERAPRAERAIACIASLLLVAIVLLVLSRLALAATIAELLALLLLQAWRGTRPATAAVAAGAAVLIALSATGPIRDVYTGAGPPPDTFALSPSAPVQTPAPTSPAHSGTPSPAPQPSSKPPVATGKPIRPGNVVLSARFREGAVRHGLHVFAHHVAFGVGTGLFVVYDPVHTAAHSLLVQILAENGVLGGAGLLTLVAFTALALLGSLRATSWSPRVELDVACLLGALVFLLMAIAAGVQLADGYTNVWAVAFALMLGLAAARATESDVSEG
jgi:hypothetical protein